MRWATMIFVVSCSCLASPSRSFASVGSPARRTNRRRPEFPAFSPARGRWKGAASARRRRCGRAARCGVRAFRAACPQIPSPAKAQWRSARTRRPSGCALAEEDVVRAPCRRRERPSASHSRACRRARRTCSPCTSTPSTSTVPCRRVVKARDEADQRRLAAAGRADDGQRLAPVLPGS